MSFSLTSRMKVPVPASNSTDWLELLTHWAELLDVMLTVLSNKDYVISGLSVTTSPASLEFSYSAGTVSINGINVSVSAGSGSLVASKFNWVYVQSGQVKVSTLPPSGASYVPIASLQTDTTGTVGPADLRAAPPVVSGITIAPFQVNPTGDINLPTGKRVKHVDTNVGSNIVLYSNDEITTVVNWGNQTAAKAWEQIDLSAVLPATAKFARLNLRLATLNAEPTGWALLEVKTNSSDSDYMYFVSDHGHGATAPFNGAVWGPSNIITLRVDTTKKFWVRSLINNLGGTGAYYAFIQLVGYVV
jgi:hypothetical protein